MPEFENAEGWVSFFEDKFPHGLLATLALGEPEMAGYDKSPQMLVFRVGVDVFDAENPTIFLSEYESGHPMFLRVGRVIDQGDGRLVIQIQTPDDTPRYVILSPYISDADRELVKARREGGIFS